MGNCVGEETWEAKGQRLKHLECIKTTGQEGQFTGRFIRQAVSLLFALVTCGAASC